MKYKQGLKHLKEKKFWQKQDFSFKKTFGSFDVSQLPEEYLLVSEILDQDGTYKCTAYASCAIQESQEGIQFNPDDYFYHEGIINGEFSDSGYDLRTNMKTGVKYGFLPIDKTKGEAKDFKESSYFRVDNPINSTDLFDDIRVAMWLAKEEKRCVNTGVNWQSSWRDSDHMDIKGVISTTGNEQAGHCIKVAGWKTIGEAPYLVIQNSYGVSLGDEGLN